MTIFEKQVGILCLGIGLLTFGIPLKQAFAADQDPFNKQRPTPQRGNPQNWPSQNSLNPPPPPPPSPENRFKRSENSAFSPVLKRKRERNEGEEREDD